jgi:protein gp37
MPLKVKKSTKFFANSMSDLFHEQMPFDFLDRVFEIIAKTPWHSYQILTKREAILRGYCAGRKMPDNVWLGVSVESAKVKDRIDALRSISARIRFLSVEPLIADVGALDLTGIHWVIVGGESGPRARPMRPEWALTTTTRSVKRPSFREPPCTRSLRTVV